MIGRESKLSYPLAWSLTPLTAPTKAPRTVVAVSHTPFWRRSVPQGRNKKAPPQETEKGLIPRADRKARQEPLPNRLSSLAQALAPRTVRGISTSATLGKPLSRECLFYPLRRHLWTPTGQWLVCCADASPTEDPDTASRKTRKCSVQLQTKTGLSNVSRKIDMSHTKFTLSLAFPYSKHCHFPK